MKKVLSIVLSIAMVLCMMPAMAFAGTTSAQADAAYSDTAGTACEGAVNVLSALGVVDGYTDGTYKPEQTVTRAEMAKLIVTALGVADYATATTSKFTDMGAASWAIPYVEYAANLNIVNGYGDGRFGPNDTVTYEQAVTMIVRALGYTDECKEMNGSWPAIYIQKAMALGIFEDVVNGGANGATRGDTAIMLFNAIDLPEVYADGDGATQYKSGSTTFTGSDGKSFKGTSMLATLNKDAAAPTYDILSASAADSAVANVRSLVGAVGKIYTNKDGDVLSIGDLKSTFITGTVNDAGDKLTASDGTKYTIDNNCFSVVDSSDGTILTKENNTPVTEVPLFVNGAKQGTVVMGSSGALDNIKENQGITVAAKVSGKTIKNIFSVSTWSKAKAAKDLFEESDAATITSKQELFGYDFKTDDDGDVDYTTFILTGVDSLDQIEEDNVVYAYYDDTDTIRKVEVGTQIVEGTLESFTAGTVADSKDAGKQATFTVDGTDYKGTNASPADSSAYEDWTLSGDSEVVDIGDSVKLYLDASGKIYQIEKTASASKDYALVLDFDKGASGSITGGAIKYNEGLNDDNALLKVMTANGEDTTLTIKNGATINASDLKPGAIITYNLNSSNKIKSITVKDAYNDGVSPSKISKKGYIDGKAILDSAVIFSVDTAGWTFGNPIDEDDVDVISLNSILDKDNVYLRASNTNSKDQYDVLVVDSNITSDDIYYGLVTSVASVDSDTYDNDYRVTMLVNGETKSYYTDESMKKNTFYAFKLNTSGEIDEIATVVSTSAKMLYTTENSYLGTMNVTGAGISVSANVAKDPENASHKITLDSDVIYYNYDGGYEVGSKTDLTGADDGYVVFFFETADDEDDVDGVADVVIIAPADKASLVLGS